MTGPYCLDCSPKCNNPETGNFGHCDISDDPNNKKPICVCNFAKNFIFDVATLNENMLDFQQNQNYCPVNLAKSTNLNNQIQTHQNDVINSEYCKIKVDICQDTAPCNLENSICKNCDNGYSCICLEGKGPDGNLTGYPSFIPESNCEEDFKECNSNLNQCNSNFSTCVEKNLNEDGMSYFCECKNGFTGPFCNQFDCGQSLCNDVGTDKCSSWDLEAILQLTPEMIQKTGSSEPVGYTCQCKPGYVGPFCNVCDVKNDYEEDTSNTLRRSSDALFCRKKRQPLNCSSQGIYNSERHACSCSSDCQNKIGNCPELTSSSLFGESNLTFGSLCQGCDQIGPDVNFNKKNQTCFCSKPGQVLGLNCLTPEELDRNVTFVQTRSGKLIMYEPLVQPPISPEKAGFPWLILVIIILVAAIILVIVLIVVNKRKNMHPPTEEENQFLESQRPESQRHLTSNMSENIPDISVEGQSSVRLKETALGPDRHRNKSNDPSQNSLPPGNSTPNLNNKKLSN